MVLAKVVELGEEAREEFVSSTIHLMGTHEERDTREQVMDKC